MGEFSSRYRQWLMVYEVREFLEDQYPVVDVEAMHGEELVRLLTEHLLVPKDVSPPRFAAQLRSYFKGNIYYSTSISKTPASQ
jgi:hypothetical protein